MTAQTRLKICFVMVLMSVLYGWVIVTQGTNLASAVAVGYVALILTAFAANQFWRR